MRLDRPLAEHMAGIALGHVTRAYPHKLDHVWGSDSDATTPRAQHPIFFGSFDWHSCVHGWWTLRTLRRLFPGMAQASAIDALAAQMFTDSNVAAELAYLERPLSASFERPYGWAWMLALHGEEPRVEPLARCVAARFPAYLSKLTYPITVGTHFNTAFALTLAIGWAERHDPALAATISDWAINRFGGERHYRGWEPGGDEFLSPALSVALLMSRVMERSAFAAWFSAFLPDLDRFEPVTVSDRSDGKIAHLDGLNLSRAWALRSIARVVDRADLSSRADRHLHAALPHIAGDYMGEHWLASFALLALTV